MAPLTPPALILVTGASGFVGTYTVKELVDLGYKVRTTVRSEAKGEYIKGLFGVEYAVVPDMMTPGAYDEAVKGVDGVVHVASPLDVRNTGDPQLTIGPAVAGVVNLLTALEGSTTVKRVVQLSSVAAIADSVPGRHVESDWNEVAPALCEKDGAAAEPGQKYAASKALAERAFWKFFEQPRSFDGVSLNPGYIFGPPLQFSTSNEVVGSNSIALMFLQPGLPEAAQRTNLGGMVDARDVAAAAGLALAAPDAGGERYIINAAPLHANDFLLAAEHVPSFAKAATPGNPDKAFRAELDEKACIYDGRKATTKLGLKYRDKDATLKETLESLAAKM